jgi:hypothetical protein
MIDSIALNHSLAGLLEAGAPEALDWDTSALADWPNVAPVRISRAMRPSSSAESLAAPIDQAR